MICHAPGNFIPSYCIFSDKQGQDLRRSFSCEIIPSSSIPHQEYITARTRKCACRRGEDLEGSALELPPRGRVPLDSRLFKGVEGWGSSLYRLVTSCLADTSFVVDRPPTHFFVKKKFIPAGDADRTTQRVLSVFCYAHTLCGEGERCATHRGFIPSLCEIASGLLLRSYFLRGGGTLCHARNPPVRATA